MAEPVVGNGLSEKADELRKLFVAKITAELAEADRLVPGADTVRWGGDPLASVVAVKGRPGPAEASGGAVLSGADGGALRRALEALGWVPPRAFATLARPVDRSGGDEELRRLRLQIEAVDPRVVIALDGVAAQDLARAFGLGALPPGAVAVAGGRRFVALDDFEAALSSERAKRRAWLHLKSAAPDGPVY